MLKAARVSLAPMVALAALCALAIAQDRAKDDAVRRQAEELAKAASEKFGEVLEGQKQEPAGTKIADARQSIETGRDSLGDLVIRWFDWADQEYQGIMRRLAVEAANGLAVATTPPPTRGAAHSGAGETTSAAETDWLSRSGELFQSIMRRLAEAPMAAPQWDPVAEAEKRLASNHVPDPGRGSTTTIEGATSSIDKTKAQLSLQPSNDRSGSLAMSERQDGVRIEKRNERVERAEKEMPVDVGGRTVEAMRTTAPPDPAPPEPVAPNQREKESKRLLSGSERSIEAQTTEPTTRAEVPEPKRHDNDVGAAKRHGPAAADPPSGPAATVGGNFGRADDVAPGGLRKREARGKPRAGVTSRTASSIARAPTKQTRYRRHGPHGAAKNRGHRMRCNGSGAALARNPGWYIVKAGDTLWGISKRHYGSGQRYPRLHAANRRRLLRGPHWIMPCQRIYVPQRKHRAQGTGQQSKPRTAIRRVFALHNRRGWRSNAVNCNRQAW